MANRIFKIIIDKRTPRIEYAFDFVFKQRGFDYELLDANAKEFDLIYSTNSSQTPCSDLLYSEGFPSKLPDFDNNVLVFDGIADHFASVFFVLCRMEEYMIKERDHHGRFPVESSLQYQNNFLDKAVCDRWANHIIEHLLGEKVPSPKVAMEPTFDIDNAFAYKHKSGLRRQLSIAKDVFNRDRTRLKERKAVDNGGFDPYDTFDYIDSVAEYTGNARIFWLVKSNAKYDRNVPVTKKEIGGLIRSLSKNAAIGLHPSYSSFGDLNKVKKEKQQLETILGSEVNSSRQHFLRFELPESYNLLSSAGFKNEYSMGFAAHYGFRCGTARSIPWFDINKNEVTDLMVHPFVYMDGTLNEYMQLSVYESVNVVSELYKEVWNYGGVYRFIWHNETIGDYGKWKDWLEVLERTIALHYE